MKKHLHRLLPIIISLISVTICCETKKTKSTDINQKIAVLDSLGQSILKEGQVVGFSVAIMQGADTVYNQGFGFMDVEKTMPITKDTRFLMASVSKLIGSTLLMKLVEEEKLSLNKTLFELMPDFPNPEQAKKITLEHMISHTSGLPEYAKVIDTIFVKTGKAPTREDYLNFFKGRDLLFEPGSNYSYCNSGYVLLGIILEQITGNTLQQEFDRVINEPTSMDLKLIAEATSLPEMSPYWELVDSNYLHYPHWTWIQGDGGLTATSIMLAQFPRQWASGVIISPSSFEEMIMPRILTDGIQTGYGLGVRNGEFFGERIIGHTGGHKSTYAIMVYFPARDVSFVVFVNTDHTPTNARKVFGLFAAEYLGVQPNEPSISIKPLNDPSKYVGFYGAHNDKTEQIIEIKLNEEGILVYCYKEECFPMAYIGDHKFWIEEWPFDHVIFEINEKGEAIAIKEYFTGFYSLLRKKLKQNRF
ncbi:MAG: serine hydrolase domain-containing protein [Ekhidna sp.]|uniref:serine hydrolase domain-containing protein n=1 Tax=Ekhidna sp. TaxID=2608089 RepID=UPI0032EC3CFF